MTQTTYETPPAPPARQLVRPTDRRVWLGVAEGFGRYTGTDPVLWRVALGVLALFGGTGVVLYLLGWLLVPPAGEPSVLDRVLRRPRSGRTVLLVLGAVLLCLVVAVGEPGVSLPLLLVVGVLAYAATRRDRTPPPAATDEPEPERERERGPRTVLLTLAAVLAVGVLLVGLDGAGVGGITLGRLLAALLVTTVVGFAVGLRWRPSWGLALPAVVLALGLALVGQAGVPIQLSAGERSWTPTGDASFDVGAGHGVLDLRELPGAATVQVTVGAGQLEVLRPAGTRLRVLGAVGLGASELPGEPVEDAPQGRRVELVRDYGPAVGPLVTVDARVGLGLLTVRTP